jgi:hypothetical protein
MESCLTYSNKNFNNEIKRYYKCKYNTVSDQFTLPIDSSKNIYVSTAPTSTEVSGNKLLSTMKAGKFDNVYNISSDLQNLTTS